jgi:predicted DCC family thiol-disulfide oxidoreductase YuxK
MSAVTLTGVGRDALAAFARAWSRIWFQEKPTTPIELTRIGIGAALLVNYSLATPYLFYYWGDTGIMPLESAIGAIGDPWVQSLFYYFTAPWQLAAFHAVFLLCCAAFMLGWRTSIVKWIVLIGEISYCGRNPILVYGVDLVLCPLLLVLCLAPIGRALSLDRVRAVRCAKLGSLDAVLPVYRSEWAGACTRLIQLQMALLFFHSGIAKIRGDEWWNGDVMWILHTHYDYYNNTVLNLLASHYWIGNAAVYFTLLLEIAFPFLIWQRSWRAIMLAGAIFLHVMIALLMGMPYFSFVMICGHMSFVRLEWLTRLGEAWKRSVGDMEMIYDGDCGFCKRSMAAFLAFDGLQQVSIRNFRTQPSPVVSDDKIEKALYLVLPDGRALPGFEAYRYVVARVPGLWWLIPLFYVPVLSRLIGHPLYNWVASNRGRLSAMGV